MAFPKMKKKGWWIFEEDVPDGWEALGEVEKFPRIENGKSYYEIDTCGVCNGRVHVGREGDGLLFRYCPRCRCKIKKSK